MSEVIGSRLRACNLKKKKKEEEEERLPIADLGYLANNKHFTNKPVHKQHSNSLCKTDHKEVKAAANKANTSFVFIFLPEQLDRY
jgi:hypothetical protein